MLKPQNTFLLTKVLLLHYNVLTATDDGSVHVFFPVLHQVSFTPTAKNTQECRNFVNTPPWMIKQTGSGGEKKPLLSTDNTSCRCYGSRVKNISAPLWDLKSMSDQVFLSVPKQRVPGQLVPQGATSSLQVTRVSCRTAVLRVRAADGLSGDRTPVRLKLGLATLNKPARVS